MHSQTHPRVSDACPTIEELQAFCHGRLVGPEIDFISEHVQSCERCATMLVEWSVTPCGQPFTHDPPDTSSETVSFSATPAPIERIGRYRIVRLIGHGGFGRVFLARDEQLDRLVAIKVPHQDRLRAPDDIKAYHHEARLHAAVDHPHVIPIYDVGSTSEAPFYAVSKFIAGTDLAERLRRQRPDYITGARWVASLADALQHIHSQHLLHRDVKPRNVMIDMTGQVYLMDFGLATRQRDDGTDAVAVAGTPGYIAPEQTRGDSSVVDCRSDVYSLGVLFYELLTGRRPFQGGKAEVLYQSQSSDPPPPKVIDVGVPRDLEAICLKAIARDPALRYQKAADLAEDLRCWLAHEPLRHARIVGPIERYWLWVRRRPVVAGLLGAVAASLMLLGLTLMNPSPVSPPTLRVAVRTKPPDADVHFVPIDANTGQLHPAQGKRGKDGETLLLTPGYYLVVAVASDGRFHEVFRYVPENPSELPNAYDHRGFKSEENLIYLPTITLPEVNVVKNMCLVPSSEAFSMGSADNPTYPIHRRRIPKYYLDTKEVTVEEFLQVRPNFRFAPDAPVPPGNMPITGVSWDEAVLYAEIVGKRLPDEDEYEYAATEFGRRSSSRTQEFVGWPFAPSGQPDSDRVTVPGQPPIFGLCTNVAEWTGSWKSLYPGQSEPGRTRADPMKRVVRGGPWSVLQGRPDALAAKWRPFERVALDVPLTFPGLGFRCARSAQPRISPERFTAHLP